MRRPRSSWRALTGGLRLAVLLGISTGAQAEPRPARFLREIPWAETGVWLKADTHVHTQFSDGQYPVSQVAARAVQFGCDVLALTDHGDRKLRAASPEYFEALRVARRQFPQLVLLAGLEWNVPPFAGDEHATVLVSPELDEERILTTLKHRFDDHERTERDARLALDGMRFLAGAARPEQPIVMLLNHPGRKGRAMLEAIEQWRSAGPVFVALSGAPGHQGARVLGNYPNEAALVDRWDPIAAVVGGVWDQLLQKGVDVWAARAPSDFHDDSPTGLNDYWPGQFSETWLYAPARTPAGALAALQRGSFFAAHGHIVRQAQLEARAAGLPRPAIAGETLEIAPGSTITVSVRCLVPPNDWEGRPNRIDQIELIAITPSEAKVIATGKLEEPAGTFTHSLPVATATVLRARGRRIDDSGPDLMFYTNPIRISVAEQPAGTVADASPDGSRPGLTDGWIRRIGAAALLLLVLAALLQRTLVRAQPRVRASSLGERTAPAAAAPARVAGGAAAPRQAHLILAALGMTAFAVYGSLVPLHYTPLPWNEAVERFLHIPFFEISVQQRADFVANILLFIPIGFLWLGALTVDRASRLWDTTAAALVFVNGAVLSLAIEFTQLWFPPRTVSQNDIVAETIGGGIGVALWLLLGQALVDWVRGYAAALRRNDQLGWLLQAYLLGLILYSLMPYDLTISLSELFEKHQQGRIALWHAGTSLPLVIYEYATNALLYVPVGMLAASVWTKPDRPLRPLPVSVSLAAGIVVGIEAAQLFVYSRYSDASDVLTGVVGAALGALALQRWKGRSDMALAAPGRLPPALPWAMASAAYYLVLLAIFWWPYDFCTDADLWRERYAGIAKAPFARLYWGTELNFVTEVLRKLLFFAPLGPLLVKTVRCVPAPRAVRFTLLAALPGAVLLLAVGVELGQVFQRSHYPDITDILLYSAGGVLGMLVALRFVRAGGDVAPAGAFAPAVIAVPPARPTDVVPLTPAGRGQAARSGRWTASIAGGVALAILAAGVLIRLRSAPAAADRFLERASPAPAVTERSDQVGPAEPAGVRFTEPPQSPGRPAAAALRIPDYPGAWAVWGATGRDARGRIWIGASAHGISEPSARLFVFDPATGQIVCRGDVVEQLDRAGKLRAGEGQMKIHTKLIEGPDGWLYFASMDEQGERTDGSRLPSWGGHLWRLRPGRDLEPWEHLAATRHALIAVALAGSKVYALGYFPHVVYQYDISRKQLRSAVVQSIGGHVSRNFLVDHRGHVYVPRVDFDASPSAPLSAALVELDDQLREVARTPLEHYLAASAEETHGIIGFQYLADRAIVFVTHLGFLYRVTPSANGPARVEPLGWFHPAGPAYIPSMFTFDGKSHILGLAHGRSHAAHDYEWVTFDLASRAATAEPIEITVPGGPPAGELLLYGSLTRDDAGHFYVGGLTPDAPWLVQIRVAGAQVPGLPAP